MNVNYLGAEGRVYAVRRYDIRRKQMQDLVIQDFKDDRITRRIDARAADWRGSHWIFRDGVVRQFDGDREQAAPFDSLSFAEITETPDDLTRDEVDPNQMSLAALQNYTASPAPASATTPRYDTEIHPKRAFLREPDGGAGRLLAGHRLRRGGIAIGFGLSFLLFLVYIGLVRWPGAGARGSIPPWPAAWLGNIVFGCMGLVLIKAPK
jgi:lipopolysaccharide export LptBFGC system permease protein LptF